MKNLQPKLYVKNLSFVFKSERVLNQQLTVDEAVDKTGVTRQKLLRVEKGDIEVKYSVYKQMQIGYGMPQGKVFGDFKRSPTEQERARLDKKAQQLGAKARHRNKTADRPEKESKNHKKLKDDYGGYC